MPTELSNGNTKVELFTRVNRVLPQSGENGAKAKRTEPIWYLNLHLN